jgi:hypothetical protein
LKKPARSTTPEENDQDDIPYKLKKLYEKLYGENLPEEQHHILQ